MQNVIPNLLKQRAYLTPERTAIYFQEQSLTFKELYDRALKTAGQLNKLGLERGQFAAVLLGNHLDSVVILFSMQLIGVKTIILNNRLTAAELLWQLHDSKAVALIMEDSFADLTPIFAEQLPVLSLITKTKLFLQEPLDVNPIEEIFLDEICTIMYTSGTTGNPKGVIQTYGNHWWSAIGSALNLGVTERDCWLCAVPLFHISGFSILMKSVIYGMPIVLHEKFDVEQTMRDMEEKQVTIMSVVGTMLTRVVDCIQDREFPSSVRCMLLGGGPAPLPLLKACMDKQIPVFQTYGMTETSSQIVTLSPEYSFTKLGSAGKALFPAQIRIERHDGTIANPREEGEIVVKGPNVTPGYLYRPDVVNEKFRDGWLHTGDAGYMDEDGFLYVLDRRSDLIISGGENIYPAEIESVLLAHPEVQEAGVVGADDEKWGQVPVAFIVLKNSKVISQEELKQFCASQLAKYKIPKACYFMNSLPRNASNKLLRRTLKEQLNKGRLC
ncbi:o-succinylbenzoate--CoA ligase [Bacillus rubiinfantis]|uniref:o-succinylbenzoate--CoA ligase n=1 Tax=Bacillus rubiinfantis TaxID=1499680 RepID=UPI0005A8BEA2|nr:o-succinylbenzoate--CoA ligase [Bacillus rubiinfantis]